MSQIIYTDIDPDSTVAASINQMVLSYYIDLDNDSTYEFELRHFNPGPGNEAVELHGEEIGNKEVIIKTNFHAKVLQAGDIIGITSNWGNDGFGVLDNTWYGGGDKYFGFRFRMSGEWHYGWARVNIPADHLSFIIKDYAYQSLPNTSIGAGAITSGIEESSLTVNLVEIYPNPVKNIAVMQFMVPVSHAEITIYNCYGKKIQVIEDFSGDNILFNTNHINSGFCFYQVKQEKRIIAYGKFIISR